MANFVRMFSDKQEKERNSDILHMIIFIWIHLYNIGVVNSNILYLLFKLSY